MIFEKFLPGIRLFSSSYYLCFEKKYAFKINSKQRMKSKNILIVFTERKYRYVYTEFLPEFTTLRPVCRRPRI